MRKLTVQQLLKAKKVNNQESYILTELRRNGATTNRNLSNVLGLPINVITPRNYSLRLMGLVKEGNRVYDSETNRTVKTWVAV